MLNSAEHEIFSANKYETIVGIFIFFSREIFMLSYIYEGVSLNNQPIPFPMDREGHDFHALFQYMFYTCVQNCTRIESFFNKIWNVKHG